MSYTKVTCTDSTRVSAQLLNNIETQYDEVMAQESTWNNHDSRYYTEAQAIVKFFSLDFMGENTGADADLLDGYHAADIVGTGLEIGSIIWWHDDPNINIPDGWYVCNGANGTNDYRNKFVIGSSSLYTTKSTYGKSTSTPVTDYLTIGTTSLTTDQIPGHTHSWTETHGAVNTTDFNGSGSGYNGSFTYWTTGSTNVSTESTGSGTAHGHTGGSCTFSSQSNIPPYYALYLIQRKE